MRLFASIARAQEGGHDDLEYAVATRRGAWEPEPCDPPPPPPLADGKAAERAAAAAEEEEAEEQEEEGEEEPEPSSMALQLQIVAGAGASCWGRSCACERPLRARSREIVSRSSWGRHPDPYATRRPPRRRMGARDAVAARAARAAARRGRRAGVVASRSVLGDGVVADRKSTR